MKSLEIVDRKLSEAYSGGQFATDNAFIEDDELITIRKDLEVLEILRNNLYYWYGNAGKPITEIHTFLNDYNNPKEFKKVKQWLEGNENDR